MLGPSYWRAGHFTDTVTQVEPIVGAGYTALPGKVSHFKKNCVGIVSPPW